jgi:predicted Rossmann-fold nucleotide-binding protein
MWVDAQLDGHGKPLGLLNVGGFFDGLLTFVDTMIAERFLPPQHRDMVIAMPDAENLLDAFRSFAPVTTSKWM